MFFWHDRDSIIYLGKPDGPTCHTGAETCYYTRVSNFLEESEAETENKFAETTLYSLESTIWERKAELELPQNGKPSWTKRLLLNSNLLCSKIREEADELCRTLEEGEDKSRTASEMADVLYHATGHYVVYYVLKNTLNTIQIVLSSTKEILCITSYYLGGF